MKRKKIFFITDTLISFITQDIEILEDYFDVRVLVVFNEVHNKKNPVSVISFLYKLIKGVIWSDITFCWFATDTAYAAIRLAQIFRKKSVVIVGGYEVANEPGLNYGGLIKPLMASRIVYTLNNVTIVIPVSEFTKKEILHISKPNKMQLIYNSIDTQKYTPLGEKENIAITVCYISERSVAIKGLITFVNTAKLLPNIKFFIVGKIIDESIEQLKVISPPNLSFITNISEETILQWYRKAKVYCQLSHRESFGVALAEAMACGCIPVITNRGAMHEITGDTGYQVPYGDANATAEAIKKALASQDGDKARKRIVENFTLVTRGRKLFDLIEKL